ncbi:hypothetical protein HanIR_Chr05g0231191 [Helianthus annuus]|nr:hypothetical protein HanIR_Chr05g0231191 [Helianthus annuus]
MKTRGYAITELSWNKYVRSTTSIFANSMIEDAMEELTFLFQTCTFERFLKLQLTRSKTKAALHRNKS